MRPTNLSAKSVQTSSLKFHQDRKRLALVHAQKNSVNLTELARNWNSQRFQKVLFVQFYEVHRSKISKLWVGEAPKQFTYVFSGMPYSILGPVNDFFVAECLFLRHKVFGWSHVD